MNSEATDQPAAVPAAPAATPLPPCANCGAAMSGPYCHACGQPEKGMVRPLANVMSDVADTIFNVDSRIFRSILPLYFRPGLLTQEYFIGRRTRYVTPFRLFFFLCVVSIIAIQFALNLDSAKFDLLRSIGNSSIETSATEADVDQNLQKALDALDGARKVPGLSASDATELDRAVVEVRKQADKRRAWLKKKADALARGDAPPPDPNEELELDIGGQPWDPKSHPIAVSWLPAFANAKLNELTGRARDNLLTARKDPRRLIASVFSVLPQTLFVLMPLFAVLLKIVFLFKRRLYMEHLIVALHSHAFIFLSLLLLALISLLEGATGNAALLSTLSLANAAVWIWLPIYLFLMQKRVYRQGWLMAPLTYGVIGLSYFVLLGFGLAGAFIVGLTLD